MKQLRNHQTDSLNVLDRYPKGIIHLPTGTGKTLIQSRNIFNSIIHDNSCKPYVIMSPRILLSNQLLNDVGRDLNACGIKFQCLVVHSGNTNTTEDWFYEQNRDIETTTSHEKIREDYERALRENVPLIISSTYHSAQRIVDASLPVYLTQCDEAHYIVSENFQWVATDDFPSERKYFFTATLKVTSSDDGLGMNNKDRFGSVLYFKSPAEMVEAGEIVRPRLHIVDATEYQDVNEDIVDAKAIAEAFKEHKALLNGIGGKLLVAAKGTSHLKYIVENPAIQDLLIRPNMTIFDISSEYGARINHQSVDRNEFLTRLQGLKDYEDAIIIHIDILSEGIDVPGITGIMPLTTLGIAKFLQTMGRATRLYIKDRERLYSGQMQSNEYMTKFVKPYAWVIIPAYGENGNDMKRLFEVMVESIREFGFNPFETVVMRQKRGIPMPAQIAETNTLGIAVKGLLEFGGQIIHDIEEEEKLAVTNRIKQMNEEEFLTSSISF